MSLTLIGQDASLLLVSGVMDEVDGSLAVFEVTETGEYKLKWVNLLSSRERIKTSWIVILSESWWRTIPMT